MGFVTFRDKERSRSYYSRNELKRKFSLREVYLPHALMRAPFEVLTMVMFLAKTFWMIS